MSRGLFHGYISTGRDLELSSIESARRDLLEQGYRIHGRILKTTPKASNGTFWLKTFGRPAELRKPVRKMTADELGARLDEGLAFLKTLVKEKAGK